MKKIPVLILVILTLQTVSFCLEEQWRAFWVVRDALLSRDSVTKMVDKVADSNCNMIFVQVCGRGDAYYASRLLPRAEVLGEESFDPLKDVIGKAHQRGLEVHAWVNTFLVWSATDLPQSSRHVIHDHPEWIEYTREERSLSDYKRPHPFGCEGLFLSPGHPDVRDRIAECVSEIVRDYQVDGIHLDYIRYPNEETGFNPIARSRFRDQYQDDPIRLFGKEASRRTPSADADIDSLRHLWNKWRCMQVTETVRMVRDRIQLEKPRVKISAAVKPEYGRAVEKYGQDWKAWMEEGLLDFVVAMAYSPSTDQVVQQIREARQILGHRSFFAGIGIYNQSVSRTVEQIKAIRSIGVDGLSLFSYNSVADNDDYLQHLKETCFFQASTNTLQAPMEKD
jgi:uncharacterized lipoprotein YddW (UPF0748 family)